MWKFLHSCILIAAVVGIHYPPASEVIIYLNSTASIGDEDGPSHAVTDFLIAPMSSSVASGGTSPIATGTFVDAISSTGQSRLSITTLPNEGATDRDFFYAIGLAEGYLTAERIVQQLYNVVWSKPRQNQYIYEFLSLQYNYMREKSIAHWRDDAYWFQVSLSLARLDGMMDGLKARQSSEASHHETTTSDPIIWHQFPVTYLALYELNSITELGEIAGSVAANDQSINTGRFTDNSKPIDEDTGRDDISNIHSGLAPPDEGGDLRIPEHMFAEMTKCSSLVKLVNSKNPSLADLIVSHNTWTSYGEMLRIFKTIDFTNGVVHPSFLNRKISMSSYPGYLSSTDDWVTLPDSQLLITETTNECLSRKRLRKYVQPHSVTTVIRSIVASVMAKTGSDWLSVFSKENSGTYNNQWILVNYGAFDDWKTEARVHDADISPKDILWIIEQAPGLVVGQDMTDHLFETGFWASYNRPYYAVIANVSGYTAASKLHGEWYEHAKCPRARIFDAVQSSALDVDSMRSIMSLNMWNVMNASYLHTHECPKNQIAGRYDIDPSLPVGTVDYVKCGPVMAYGALDLKVMSSELMKTDSTIMQSSPLWNNTVPAFNWSALPAEAQVTHWGQPEYWNFPAFKWTGSVKGFDGGPLPPPPYVKLPMYVIDSQKNRLSKNKKRTIRSASLPETIDIVPA